ncbi:hypothetical protein G6F38_011987 [Rhizopus arrhizus]|nr:hypothetical protein G6F38_011987 [Rhizopus arrhizus]
MDTLFSSNQKEPSKSENDSFELYVEDNLDDDFQPVVTARKRKSKILHRVDHKRGSKAKEKLQILNSDNFDTPVVKEPFLGESTRSAFCITKSTSAAVESSTTASKTSLTFPKPSKPVPTTFKSAVTSVKSSFCPVPVDKASDIKEGPKKISKRVMTIKTTVKNIWKSAYLQPLYDLVHTTNLLVTHTFAFTKLRGLINKLFKKKEKAESLRGEMQANKSSNSPKNHFKAFFRLAELSEVEQMKQFACFPLRTTFTPCYMTLDSKIIHYHVLKSKKTPKTGSKFEIWGDVVDLNKKAFKHQGFQKSLQLQRTLETDEVGVSIIKQNTDTSRISLKPNIEKKVDGNQTEHIEKLGQADLKSTEGKCVLIDPGRRDLMYCLKETSTVEEKQILIFIKNNRSNCSRHFRYLRKCTQPFVVQKAETILFRSESNSVDLKKFVQYIKTGVSVKNTLYEYYENETTKSKETYFPESEFDFRVDQKCNLYYGNLFIARIRGFFPQPENYSTDSSKG